LSSLIFPFVVQSEDEAIKKAQCLCCGGRAVGGEKPKYKVITLGGTVIHKSGNLTGGTSAKGDRSAKLRGASDKTASKTAISEKEYSRVKERYEQLLKELIDVEAEMAAAFRQQDEEAQITSKVSKIKMAREARHVPVTLFLFA
jgi:chromosome segregation ATPase